MKSQLQKILKTTIPVHNCGAVSLIDVMGDDKAIEEAARVSYIGHEEELRSQKETRGLIRYLMRHRHTTPFEMVELKFWIKAPFFIWRQWIRHRTANVNEISGRYAELPNDYYIPEPQFINKQSKSNKQGRSSEEFDNALELQNWFNEEANANHYAYQKRLSMGMAKELARINLPLSTMTEAIWKLDLHNLFHFLNLRLHSHAQYEIRTYAEKIANLVKLVVPLAWEAFDDYVLSAISFSKQEQNILNNLLITNQEKLIKKTINKLNELNLNPLSTRECKEFFEKVKKLKLNK